MKERYTISRELSAAREYEMREGALVPPEARPVYHFSPRIGWLNDPNGLSCYEGQYHLFYQYHPYSTYWGPMHWGHAVSTDMIRWEYKPAALAPDREYDQRGCFSGSALTMDDGRHLIMYTGCCDGGGDPTGRGRWLQSQNLAVLEPGGTEYVKYEKNPVITQEDLPDGADPYEFRDPYLWRMKDGSYRALVGSAAVGGEAGTRLIVFRSEDGFRWSRGSILFEDEGRIGVMWECPSFFRLEDQHVLIASPMDMKAEEDRAVGTVRFPKGNNVCYMTGRLDTEKETFAPSAGSGGGFIYKPVDEGLDFYAPQVMTAADGRRVMIGWMQDPQTANQHDDAELKIFGQMTIPRELTLREGNLIQWPVRELEEHRRDPVRVQGVVLGEERTRLPGISGRACDIEIELSGLKDCGEFSVRWAEDEHLYTELRYRPDTSVMTIDRSRSGQREGMTKERTIRVNGRPGELNLRILLDRRSAEIFINGGEQVMSVTFDTGLQAEGISFLAKGAVKMDILKYEIV